MLLTSEEIKEIREKYKLGKKAFSKLLGLGEYTIFRFEGGRTPSKSISQLIEMARNPEWVESLIPDAKLSQNMKKRLQKTINEIKSQELHNKLESIDERFEEFIESEDKMFIIGKFKGHYRPAIICNSCNEEAYLNIIGCNLNVKCDNCGKSVDFIMQVQLRMKQYFDDSRDSKKWGIDNEM